MNKLRDGNTSSTPPPVAPLSVPTSSSSTSSISLNNHPSQSRRVTSTNSTINTKNMMKSRSTQNLILPTSAIQQTKQTLTRRIKISRVTRRPPALPTTCHPPSSTSSSASSNASSPTKSLQSKENDQTKQFHHHHTSPSSTETTLPLRQLDNTNNDLMPRWAQDCFYRTVVLGLKPLLLHDIPASPNKPPQRSSSTCSIESTDSLETASELQACSLNDTHSKGTPVRRSISIPDYRQMKQNDLVLPSSLSGMAVKEE